MVVVLDGVVEDLVFMSIIFRFGFLCLILNVLGVIMCMNSSRICMVSDIISVLVSVLLLD